MNESKIELSSVNSSLRAHVAHTLNMNNRIRHREEWVEMHSNVMGFNIANNEIESFFCIHILMQHMENRIISFIILRNETMERVFSLSYVYKTKEK